MESTKQLTGVRQYDTVKRSTDKDKIWVKLLPKKFSQKFEDDWVYLMKYTEKEVRHYLPMCHYQFDKDGIDPKSGYYMFDTHGKEVLKHFKCSDPITVQRIIWGKSLVNLTIKMWSEDIKSELLLKNEIESVLTESPQWVRDSLDNQIKRS